MAPEQTPPATRPTDANASEAAQTTVAETGKKKPPVDPAKLRRRRRIRWTVRGLLVAAATVACAMSLGDRLFYFPDHKLYEPLPTKTTRCEDVYFPTSDGQTLHGWFLPAQTAPRGLVVHFHGNAANITNHYPLVSWLPLRGYHVLMVDYRGYGQSTGRITRAGTYRDGLAAIDYAKTRPEYVPGRLFVYGQSLGGAVATCVVADRPEVNAVVLESTFGNYREIGARHLARRVYFPWLANGIAWLFASHGYEPLDYVARIAPRPLLVLAGGEDQICFPDLGKELYYAAGQPKDFLLVPEAEHLEVDLAGGTAVEDRIVATFESGAAAAGAPPVPGDAVRPRPSQGPVGASTSALSPGDRYFYFPDDVQHGAPPSETGVSYEDVSIHTSDGETLHGWFIHAQATPVQGIVVHLHGNAANITGHYPLVSWLLYRGYHVLMVDYRGYGKSTGRPTRAGTVCDGLAAIDYALQRPEYVRGRLFLYGQSLGGAVATCVAAARPEVSAVVLESTFGNYREIGARFLEPEAHSRWLANVSAWALLSHDYEPLDYVARIAPRPLLVLAGGQDQVCAPELGQALYDAAGQPKDFLLVPAAGHLEVDQVGGTAVEDRIVATFQAGAAAAGAPAVLSAASMPRRSAGPTSAPGEPH